VANRYDDAVKAVCALDLAGLCNWLGVKVASPTTPLRLAESAPPTTTRQMDLLVAVDDETVLHVEFQTRPERRFAQRMLDYWLRIDASLDRPGLRIIQHVIQLGDGHIEDTLVRDDIVFSYDVHRLCDEDPEQFLVDPGLVPFAALAGNDPARRPDQLRRALAVVAAVEDARGREVLARATVELAAIRLGAATISTTWKESPMPIPSVLSKLYDEGLEEGLEKGREKGLIEAVASLLRIRFGDDPGVDALASRLAALGATKAMAAVERAGSLDELS
jgi:hypothetical protein